jgi:hypothetical protein
MHAHAASHRPARHTRRLLNTTGGPDDAHQFWPVRPLAGWTSGDHHRHSKSRARPYPPALLAPGTGS